MRQISNNLSQPNLGEGLMPNNIHKSVQKFRNFKSNFDLYQNGIYNKDK